MVERSIRILTYLSEKVAPHLPFLLIRIGPKSVIRAGSVYIFRLDTREQTQVVFFLGSGLTEIPK